MSQHERIARIDGIDLATGVFPMTLATEGEASDGHILSIKGGQIPKRMPLLSAHWNEPTSQLGSINEPEKRLEDSPPRLRAVGHIEMSGEGTSAEIRRDLAHMIDKGHVTGVSIRWDEVPGKTIRRVNLPSDHPHFVDSEKANGPERWGVFFEQWRALEGSVVPIGADPKALIGRANDTTGEVQAFWRSMAEDASGRTEDWCETLAALRAHADSVRAAGACTADLINSVTKDGLAGDLFEKLEPYIHGNQTLFLPASLVELLETRADVEDELDTETRLASMPSRPTPADQRETTETDPDSDPSRDKPEDQQAVSKREPEASLAPQTFDADQFIECIGIVLDQRDASKATDRDAFFERMTVLLDERDERKATERDAFFERMTTLRDEQRRERFQKMLDDAVGRVS